MVITSTRTLIRVEEWVPQFLNPIIVKTYIAGTASHATLRYASAVGFIRARSERSTITIAASALLVAVTARCAFEDVDGFQVRSAVALEDNSVFDLHKLFTELPWFPGFPLHRRSAE